MSAVRLAGFILLGVITVGWVTGSALRRFGVAWGATVSFFAVLLARLGAALVVASIAVRAAQRGGVWFDLLALFMAVLAVFGLGLTGVLAWVWVRAESED
jgi:hypothetical protein